MKVTVLMTAYNHERFIAKAIESVLKQRVNFPFELIIGEDCSTDRTREIVNSYQRNYPQTIRAFLNESNMGPTANFLQIYGASIGEYLAILEGDDFSTDPYKLRKQVRLLDENPRYAFCFTNGAIVDDNDVVIRQDRVPQEKRKDLSQQDIISGYCPPCNTFLLRKRLVSAFPEPMDKCINGDFILAILLTDHGDAGYLDFRTASYRMHGGGIWSQRTDEYRDINFLKTCQALLTRYRDRYEEILLAMINGTYERLLQREKKRGAGQGAAPPSPPSPPAVPSAAVVATATHDPFTDNGFWTPQTRMLQKIREKVQGLQAHPKLALSIDNNPTIDAICLEKWPDLAVTRVCYPENDVQDLSQIPSDSFDIAYSHQVLEHVPKPWLAGKELIRVLKPGGIGIHTSCAFNPRHGQPAFKDYYRFLPDGLAALFEGVEIITKDEWGNRQAILYNVAIDDGHGDLGGRRFSKALGEQSDGLYPWHTWIIFRKQ